MTKRITRKSRPRAFKSLQCSPLVDGQRIGKFSCYTAEMLLQLKTEWNQKHPEKIIHSQSPRQIWQFIKNDLRNVCQTEKCWTKNNPRLQEAFAPIAPTEWNSNPNTWLSSHDISIVMKQYEQKYKCFTFIGPSPINFDEKSATPSTSSTPSKCVCTKLCNLSIKDCLNHGKHKIGIILNLDRSDQPGSHWVSLFINLKENFIFYFNSTGESMPKEVKNITSRIQKEAKSLGITLDIDENIKEHQKGDTECGMYSLYFIVKMLKDQRNRKFFKTGKITDKDMEKYRSLFFNQ